MLNVQSEPMYIGASTKWPEFKLPVFYRFTVHCISVILQCMDQFREYNNKKISFSKPQFTNMFSLGTY